MSIAQLLLPQPVRPTLEEVKALLAEDQDFLRPLAEAVPLFASLLSLPLPAD